MATGRPQLLAEVAAERADIRIRLYQIGATYRLRVSGMGWAPDSWKDYGRAHAKLLACQSYGPAEADMLRGMCRENP